MKILIYSAVTALALGLSGGAFADCSGPGGKYQSQCGTPTSPVSPGSTSGTSTGGTSTGGTSTGGTSSVGSGSSGVGSGGK